MRPALVVAVIRLRPHRKTRTSTTTRINEITNCFEVHDADVGWPGAEPIFNNFSLHIPTSKLTMIIGTVASGKSTLCKVLLGEVAILRGIVHTSDEVRSQIA